jgi:multisubunit Na+/H+ antiporter MnhC subunit
MRAGEADPHETRISVGSVRAELELAPLLRGEVRLADVYLDDVDVTVAVRGGAAVLPASLSAAVIPGVERLAVTRGQVRLVNDAGVAFLAMPFSAEASWPRALGPARVEGEIAGRSIRLTTGDRDGAGRLRIKLSSVDSLVRAEFDGWVGVDTLSDQQIGLRPDGQLTASLVRGVQDVPQLSANGRLQGGMAFLATVGAICPFVGLFGTVWGIVKALITITASGDASIERVAGPVGEALIMTAIGLAVAVPAVIFYNLLGRRNKNISDAARHFAYDVDKLMASSAKA